MSRIIYVFTAIAVFLGFKLRKESLNTDERIVDSFNKSHESWVAKGWIKN